jgi:plasmid stabilization system protein ParE
MAHVGWTPQAADDLDAIAQFIAKDSPHFASLFVANVLDAVGRIGEFPESGRIVPEIGERTIRETILGSYRVIYRCRAAAVEILTVYHGARLLDPSKLLE